MKKNNYYFLLFVALGATLTSCQDEITTLEPTINGADGAITATTTTNENTTKTSLDGYTFTWVEGDALGAGNSTNTTSVRMGLAEGEDTKKGTFTGLYTPIEGDNYVVYPYEVGKTFTEGKYTFELPTEQVQLQTGANVKDPKSIGKYAYMAGVTDSLDVKMMHLMTFIDFEIAGIKAGGVPSKLVLTSTGSTKFHTTGVFNFANSTMASSGTASTLSVAITGNQGLGEGSFKVRLAMFPQTFVDGDVWTVDLLDASNTSVRTDGMFTKTFTGSKAFEAGRVYDAEVKLIPSVKLDVSRIEHVRTAEIKWILLTSTDSMSIEYTDVDDQQRVYTFGGSKGYLSGLPGGKIDLTVKVKRGGSWSATETQSITTKRLIDIMTFKDDLVKLAVTTALGQNAATFENIETITTITGKFQIQRLDDFEALVNLEYLKLDPAQYPPGLPGSATPEKPSVADFNLLVERLVKIIRIDFAEGWPDAEDILADLKTNPKLDYPEPPMGEPVDKTGWTATASSNQLGDGGGPGAIIDGNISTYWQTPWSADIPNPPHYVIVDMKVNYQIDKIEVYLREIGNIGKVTVKVEVSNDGTTWTDPTEFGTFNAISKVESVNVSGNFLKVTVTATNDSKWVGLGEVNIYGSKQE